MRSVELFFGAFLVRESCIFNLGATVVWFIEERSQIKITPLCTSQAYSASIDYEAYLRNEFEFCSSSESMSSHSKSRSSTPIPTLATLGALDTICSFQVLPARMKPRGNSPMSSFVGHFLSHSCWNLIFTATLLVVLAIQIETTHAISNEEKAALDEILLGHPDLTSVPSWLQLTDDGNYYGRSWTSDTSTVCSQDGYDIYGVYCRGGSIIGLRMYVVCTPLDHNYNDYNLNIL